MKKEEVRKPIHNNSFGLASAILGILSVMSYAPFYGVVFGIIALVFAKKQNHHSKNGWSRAGKILAIIGIILNIVYMVLLYWLSRNPDILAQFTGGSTYGL
jgi:hypothetical protein